MTLLYEWLDHSTDEYGNAKALVYRDNYLSWRGLKHRVDRRAQEFQAMGVKEGDWVGLMLGNVPDFVILALGLSRLAVTVVPIDPTTSSREFDLVMATVPLRALITRPRGPETQPVPIVTAEPARRPPVKKAPSRVDLPESRRRLQGTLLTCSMFKRPAPDYGVLPEVVMLTSDSL